MVLQDFGYPINAAVPIRSQEQKSEREGMQTIGCLGGAKKTLNRLSWLVTAGSVYVSPGTRGIRDAYK